MVPSLDITPFDRTGMEIEPRVAAAAGVKKDLPTWRRWMALGVVLVAMGLALGALPAFRDQFLDVCLLMVTGDVRPIKMFILSFGWWAPVISAALMILQTLIAPLPAFVLAMANAMAFGPVYGFLLTTTSALLAAFLAFGLTRWLGRPFLERRLAPQSLGTLEALIDQYGAWAVLILRLFPVISFDFVSFVAGLMPIRARDFGLATFLGMLPATVAFTLIGDSIESAQMWSMIGGGLLLGVLLILALGMRRTAIWQRAQSCNRSPE